MKTSIVILATLLLLCGCGHPTDKFVGTWRLNNVRPWWVISETDGSYRVTYVGDVAPVAKVLAREGNQLVHGAVGSEGRWVFTYNPSNGHLLLRYDHEPGALDLHRQSTSTSIPTT